MGDKLPTVGSLSPGWLETRLAMGERTAYRILDVFDKFGSGESLHFVQTLPKSVLYELAAPSTSEEVRTKVAARVGRGESVNVSEVKAAQRLVDGDRPFRSGRRLGDRG